MVKTSTANPQVFSQLFWASELKLDESKPISELGLKHFKHSDGTEYYLFTGTATMYRQLPRAV